MVHYVPLVLLVAALYILILWRPTQFTDALTDDLLIFLWILTRGIVRSGYLGDSFGGMIDLSQDIIWDLDLLALTFFNYGAIIALRLDLLLAKGSNFVHLTINLRLNVGDWLHFSWDRSGLDNCILVVLRQAKLLKKLVGLFLERLGIEPSKWWQKLEIKLIWHLIVVIIKLKK